MIFFSSSNNPSKRSSVIPQKKWVTPAQYKAIQRKKLVIKSLVVSSILIVFLLIVVKSSLFKSATSPGGTQNQEYKSIEYMGEEKILISRNEGDVGYPISSTASSPLSSLTSKYNDTEIFGVTIPNSGYISFAIDDIIGPSDLLPDHRHEGSSSKSSLSLLQRVVNLPEEISVNIYNSSRRVTLIKLVDALSRYYLSYATFPASNDVKGQGYLWVNTLVEQREMSGVYEYVLREEGPAVDCGSNQQHGYCLQTDGKEAILYVHLKTDRVFDPCPDEVLVFLWSSADNKLGEVCLQGPPTRLDSFTYIFDQSVSE